MEHNEKKYNFTTMNVELTTACPLRCPQCFCSLTGGKHIDPQTAIYWIREGHRLGVSEVMLSGGETLCYPHLCQVIWEARAIGCNVNISISGCGLTQRVYEDLLKAGISRIFVSLNGSTEDINAISRDGYDQAIGALRLLQSNHYPNVLINWVMHASNAEDFPNILSLAEKYNVCAVSVIGVKPDSKQMLNTIPSRNQMEFVRDFIRSYRGKTKIFVESCYSPMLAMLGETRLFGNLNVGPDKGCDAGRRTFSVNVDGTVSPCRHIHYKERFENLEDYFDHSPVINAIRACSEKTAQGQCATCKYLYNCRPCMSMNTEIKDRIFWGNEYCPIHTVSDSHQ